MVDNFSGTLKIAVPLNNFRKTKSRYLTFCFHYLPVTLNNITKLNDAFLRQQIRIVGCIFTC